MQLHALQSPRLHFRPLIASDFSYLRSLHTDPQVMKFITNGVARTEEQSRQSLEAGLRLAKEHPGLGTWVIEKMQTKEIVGLFVLRIPAPDLNMHGFEIGYTLAPAHWGQGYASEAALRIVQYAFQELKLYRLVAIIDPHHEASRRILEKLDFSPATPIRYHDPFSGVELPSEAYYLDNPHPHH